VQGDGVGTLGASGLPPRGGGIGAGTQVREPSRQKNQGPARFRDRALWLVIWITGDPYEGWLPNGQPAGCRLGGTTSMAVKEILQRITSFRKMSSPAAVGVPEWTASRASQSLVPR